LALFYYNSRAQKQKVVFVMLLFLKISHKSELKGPFLRFVHEEKFYYLLKEPSDAHFSRQTLDHLLLWWAEGRGVDGRGGRGTVGLRKQEERAVLFRTELPREQYRRVFHKKSSFRERAMFTNA